jgi:hypothetical protein
MLGEIETTRRPPPGGPELQAVDGQVCNTRADDRKLHPVRDGPRIECSINKLGLISASA